MARTKGGGRKPAGALRPQQNLGQSRTAIADPFEDAGQSSQRRSEQLRLGRPSDECRGDSLCARIRSSLFARSSLFPTCSSGSSNVEFVDGDSWNLPYQQQGRARRGRLANFPQADGRPGETNGVPELRSVAALALLYSAGLVSGDLLSHAARGRAARSVAAF